LDKKKIVILATEGLTTNMLYHKLTQHFEVVSIIIEDKISKKTILKNRAKKVGVFKVIGQVLFMVVVMKVLQKLSVNKIKTILKSQGLDSTPLAVKKIDKVESINNQSTIDKLKSINPDFVFVNGTRIISKKVLNCINSKFINIHVGITPKYRGVHGGYWALYNNDSHLFGTTLHYIDSGIDTGGIIAQKVIQISKSDNFATYPIIQFVLGLNLLEESIHKIKTNSVEEIKPRVNQSELYYHPTMAQYLTKRILKGIK